MASLVTGWPFFSLFTPTVISRSTNRFLIETFISAIFRHWLFFSRPVFFPFSFTFVSPLLKTLPGILMQSNSLRRVAVNGGKFERSMVDIESAAPKLPECRRARRVGGVGTVRELDRDWLAPPGRRMSDDQSWPAASA